MRKITLLTPKEIKKGMLITAWYNCGNNWHAPLKVIKKSGKSGSRDFLDITCIDLFDKNVPITAVFDTDFYFFSKYDKSHKNKKLSPKDKKQLAIFKKMADVILGIRKME